MNKPIKKTFQPAYNWIELKRYIQHKYNISDSAIRKFQDLCLDIRGNGTFSYIYNHLECLSAQDAAIMKALQDEFFGQEVDIKVWVEW